MQLAMEWTAMTETTIRPFVDSGDAGRGESGNAKRFALRTDGVDWTDRNDPHPDPSSLLRTGSPRCLCRNGCNHVFSSESTFDRHLVMRDNGDARCRTPAELRSLKRPLFRDVAGVWHSGGKVETDG